MYTYKNVQLHIIILLQHVSVTPVTIIRVYTILRLKYN